MESITFILLFILCFLIFYNELTLESTELGSSAGTNIQLNLFGLSSHLYIFSVSF